MNQAVLDNNWLSNGRVAIVEGRGSTKGHVGLAIIDLRQADIEINEFIDSSTYSRLKMKLLIAEPVELIEKLRQVLGSTYDLDHVFDVFIGSPTEATVQTANFNLTQLLHLKNVLNVVDPLRNLLKNFKCETLKRKSELLNDERIDVIRNLLDDRFRSENIGNNRKNSLIQQHKKCYAIKEGVSVNLDVARRAYEELVRDVQTQEEEITKHFPGQDVRLAFSKARGFHYVWTGKSTYLKQVCQLCILAQCGSFVPAKVAILPVFLRIFSRVGHNDDLHQNLSAFALEMSEIALILQYSDNSTLLVIDELARSTSTEEGISISYAIIEKLIKLRTFTIFATHFLDLAALDVNYSQVENFHFPPQVTYVNGVEQLSPTHKIRKGPYNGPLYGFELVELSTFPEEVVQNARDLAQRLHEETADQRTVSAEMAYQRTLAKAAQRFRQVVASKDMVSKESLIKNLKAIRNQLRVDLANLGRTVNDETEENDI
ncbi:MutS domain V protein [Oesophagostomum dentatum]|uniref:MutS domain V protein n=1 Tax=Oesophagostomum dentatum TaxID=61180 RepID=A0A0B1T6N5_OESDE|nr:MutS domain V protein [Oesophagostomum dentatum]